MLLGYRPGIAFGHFGTALVFGPAGLGALGWGRGVVGGWLELGRQKSLMKAGGLQTTGILSETAGEEVRSNVAKSLGWDCRCNAFWCLDLVRQNLELSLLRFCNSFQRAPEMRSPAHSITDVCDGPVAPAARTTATRVLRSGGAAAS